MASSIMQHFVRFAVWTTAGVMICGILAASNAQLPIRHHAAAWISSQDSIKLDSTLAITLLAENRGRVVEEAVVSLIDSASGDTLETWYSVLPPESRDSSVTFWNTRGTKSGRHTLRAVLTFLNDSLIERSEQSRVVTVSR